ncbi:hypothetical protein C8R45DRAFT_1096336 [Mycena sanguinolenta]|nr:hypothetical protein C8R45DRAFT_1096336 [Mycena sanguinolenta]
MPQPGNRIPGGPRPAFPLTVALTLGTLSLSPSTTPETSFLTSAELPVSSEAVFLLEEEFVGAFLSWAVFIIILILPPSFRAALLPTLFGGPRSSIVVLSVLPLLPRLL